MKSYPGLRILITNFDLWSRSGTTLYVRDLALELQRQGHLPVAFTLVKGAISNELAEAGIFVTDDLKQLGFQPDVIHGHHHTTTMAAVQHFPEVPAIFICHDYTSATDKAPLHSHIYRYFGVSGLCVERLLREGVAEGNAQYLLNFVDLRRFQPRPALPESARRALVFSNYARDDTSLGIVAEACRQAGLELEVVGEGVGKLVTRPEEILGNYDIVFAKGKAAMEAIAVGAAVILCDFGAVGPMVTSAELDELRSLNFGFQAMREPLQPEPLLRQIAHYNPQDAARARDMLRARSGLELAAKKIVETYRSVIEEHQQRPPDPSKEQSEPARLQRKEVIAVYKAWLSLKPRQRAFFKKLPGAKYILNAVKREIIR